MQPPDPAKPNDRDRANAEMRAALAQKQNELYGVVMAWSTTLFGEGYLPVGRHYLVDKAEEDAARKEDRPPAVEMTVYCVKNDAGRRRYFTVDDGTVKEHLGYQEAFGDRLKELHPTLTFEHRRKALPAMRYSLCWGAIERYDPLSAEALAILRASREKAKAERQAARDREEMPLFTTWLEKLKAEEDQGRGPD